MSVIIVSIGREDAVRASVPCINNKLLPSLGPGGRKKERKKERKEEKFQTSDNEGVSFAN